MIIIIIIIIIIITIIIIIIISFLNETPQVSELFFSFYDQTYSADNVCI